MADVVARLCNVVDRGSADEIAAAWRETMTSVESIAPYPLVAWEGSVEATGATLAAAAAGISAEPLFRLGAAILDAILDTLGKTMHDADDERHFVERLATLVDVARGVGGRARELAEQIAADPGGFAACYTINQDGATRYMLQVDAPAALFAVYAGWTPASLGFQCDACGRGAGKRCGRCKSVHYCSTECQERMWKFHRDHCRG